MVRKTLGMCKRYVQRVLRWVIILFQVRGSSRLDQYWLLKSALFAPFHAFSALNKWQDPLLLHDCEVRVRGVGLFRLRANCDDLWHVVPWREQSIADLLRRVLRPGDVFIDAGANIGIYTVLAARLVGKLGRVISVEMMPDTAVRLDAHVLLNGLENVEVRRAALSDIGGQVVVATVHPEKYGQATIGADSQSFGTGRQISVRTTTLDEVTAGLHRVRLMKIDLEGAELAALRGGTALLAKADMVVYESWGRMRSKSNPVDELLESIGFELFQLDGNNWLASRVAET